MYYPVVKIILLLALGGRTSRIGISCSLDGIHFTSFDEPVLYPGQDQFSGI